MKNNDSPVLRSVRKSIHDNPGYTVLMLLCITASVLTALLPPLVLEKGVDLITQNKSIPFTLALLYLGLIVLSDLFESAQGASIMIFGQRLTHGIRSELCRKLNRLSAGYLTDHDSGRTASVFVNDADTIDALYSNGIIGMIADSFKIISILVIVFTKSIGLGIILLCLTPLLFLLTRTFQINTLKAQSDNRTAISKVNNHIPETIRSIRMIHVFRREKYMEDKYDEYISDSYDAVNRSNVYDSIYSPIILMTQSAVIALMMICAAKGGDMRQFFGLSVGSAVAVIAYVGKIFSPLESIGMEIQNIQSAMAGIKHINDFLNEDEEPERETVLISDKAERGIDFNKVTFGYDPDAPVLTNTSFAVRQGENVTFVGRTGAGKSTIFRLLTGLYRPQSGSIRIAGEDPTSVRDADRRRLYGLVEQNFALVPGSIRDQITLYDRNITDEMVFTALESVQLSDLVSSFEKGIDTVMHEGLFSRGQLQLLSIARAIVTSPDILLLDEITANLDSKTEALLLSSLKKASDKRTVLSISHRLSGIMKNEKIIQIGTIEQKEMV